MNTLKKLSYFAYIPKWISDPALLLKPPFVGFLKKTRLVLNTWEYISTVRLFKIPLIVLKPRFRRFSQKAACKKSERHIVLWSELRVVADIFCLKETFLFNRDLNRGCLVYVFSLRFLGSKFLINLRQFRVRKIFRTQRFAGFTFFSFCV